MIIELLIDEEKKIFTTPFAPALARRKYLEITAKAEQLESEQTTQELIDEEDEIYSILTDIVFNNQFTVNQLLIGASKKCIDEKLSEAIWDTKPKKEDESEEGNEAGK